MNIEIPDGFAGYVRHAGTKRTEALDLSVIYSIRPARAAGVFTQSRFAGPCVQVGRRSLADGMLQAVIVSSGIANVAVGDQGLRDAEALTVMVGQRLGISSELVLPSATGVIGWPLPMDKIKLGLDDLKLMPPPGDLIRVAEAIMTTDRAPKLRSARAGAATVLGMVKGAGMIEPDMATMLCYFLTDAELDGQTLKDIFRPVIERSLNSISVDTDTSTSDTAVILANGAAGPVAPELFKSALSEVAIGLAKDLVQQAEGATKLIEVTVRGARSFMQARKLAKSVVNSPLVKTAVYGSDPNWGRVAMALGKSLDPDVDPSRISIAFGPHQVYLGGPLQPGNILEIVAEYLRNSEVQIIIDLGIGGESMATVWGCDLTEEYVRINGSYTS